MERLCIREGRDFLLADRPAPGIERLVARFHGHAYDPHRHDTYAIGETLAGVQAFRYRGTACASSTGEIMVLHPDEQHDGHAAVPNGFTYRMLYADPALVRAALDPAVERGHALPFVPDAVSEDRAIAAVLDEAFAVFPGPLDSLAVDALLTGLGDALARRSGSARRKSALPFAALERARALLDAEYATPIGSEQLEKVADLDRFALARTFRAAFGTSPHRYLVARRVTAARRMIGRGVALADIAAACGFADQSHLNRHFKAHTGVTPGRYARLIQREAA